jgi:zinc protease
MSVTLLLLTACLKGPTPEVAVSNHVLDTRPTIGAAADYIPPSATSQTLDNGATLWVLPKPGLPLISLRMVVDGGKAADPVGMPGLTSFTDGMLTHGAADKDATAYAAAAEDAALSISFGTGDSNSWGSLDTHTNQLATGLSLFADAVIAPRFDAEEVETLRAQRMASLTQSKDDPRTRASWASDALYFGEGHPLANPSIGNEESIAAVTADQMRESWSARYTPSNAKFVISGDIDVETAVKMLNTAFASWTTDTVSTKAPLPTPMGTPGYFAIDNKGAAQTVLRVILPGWLEEDPNYNLADLGRIVLGGTFTSRLNSLLREEKGYTYGARATLTAGDNYGNLIASSNVRTDVTGLALADLMGELVKISAGIDDAELKKAKGSKKTKTVGAMGTRSSVADTFAGYAASDRATDSLAADLAASLGTDLESVNAVLATIDTADAIVLVVGDLDKIMPQLKEHVQAEWTIVK